MAKEYMYVRLQGYNLAEVKAALAKVIGPAFAQWESTHFLGVRIDIMDLTSAHAYDVQWAMRQMGQEPPSGPPPVTVVISLYTFTGRRPKSLQMALCEAIALQLSAEFGIPITLSISPFGV